MSNSIALFKNYVSLLDEVYKQASLTSVLDGAPELAREGANVGELVIPKISMDGLARYSRNGGYVSGDVTLTHETVACNFDRGRMFDVDAMDNAETAGVAFGRLSGEFIRTKVVPELDAFRMAEYASASGISEADAPASLSAGTNVVAALRDGIDKMDEDEVPYEERYLFITPTLMGLVEDMDTTKSKEVLKRFAKVQRMPQTRFYTAITQKDGTTAGQEAGGYARKENHQDFTATTSQVNFTVTAKPAAIQKVTVDGVAVTSGFTYTPGTGVLAFDSAPGNGKAVKVIYDTGYPINFLIVHKPAVIQFQKHIAPKVITPELNQSGDGWKFGYRNVGIADVYENKVAGIYLHKNVI